MPSTTETRQDLYALTLDLMAACNVFSAEGWACALDLEELLFLIDQAKDLAPAIRVLKAAAGAFRVRPDFLSPDLDPAWREDLLSRVDFL
jgi:hypothetical protein